MVTEKHFQELINELFYLKEDEHESLDVIIRKAELYIKKIFGNNSEYLHEISNIDFDPMPPGVSEFMNLLEIIKADVDTYEDRVDVNIKKTNLTKNTNNNSKIFIVHGHDNEMKEAVARVITQLELDPIILHEKPNKGRTIIEKFEDYSDVGYAIILLSPDDLAYPKDKKPEDAKYRARQNVILELGYFVGQLGRENVMVLHKVVDNFDIPNDYSGVLYTPYDSNGSWKQDIVKELQAAGYKADANKLL